MLCTPPTSNGLLIDTVLLKEDRRMRQRQVIDRNIVFEVTSKLWEMDYEKPEIEELTQSMFTSACPTLDEG